MGKLGTFELVLVEHGLIIDEDGNESEVMNQYGKIVRDCGDYAEVLLTDDRIVQAWKESIVGGEGE